jgi:hypothetical protein
LQGFVDKKFFNTGCSSLVVVCMCVHNGCESIREIGGCCIFLPFSRIGVIVSQIGTFYPFTVYFLIFTLPWIFIFRSMG